MKRLQLPPLFFSVRLPTLLAMFWRRHVSRLAVSTGPRKDPVSFIIFRLDSLGDVVMTTPLFRALKAGYPNSRCTVVVQECHKPLLVTNRYIDEILTLPRIRPKWLPQQAKRLLAATLLYCTQLCRRHFDFAISPRWDVDEHLATFLCVLTHAAQRVGYSEQASPAKQQINRGFDAAYSICLPPGPVRHEVLRNLAIADAVGASDRNGRLEIPLTEGDRRRAAKLLANVPGSTKLIAVGIGANSPGRRWPLKRYAEVLTRLSDRHHLQSVIVCSGPELGDALKLAGLLKKAPIILSGAHLRQVCAVLERCELFIGNDSGSAHLAAAMDCKVIVISRHPRDGHANHFNSPLRFAPLCTHVRVLQPAQGIDTCRTACCVVEPHCITQVSVEEVVTAAAAMLQQPQSPAKASPHPWPEHATRGLLHSHSPEAIRRAIETVCPEVGHPFAPL